MTAAQRTILEHQIKSHRCAICGRTKNPKRPFDRTCYYALPEHMRAGLWIDFWPELLDNFREAREWLKQIGMRQSA